MEKIQNKEDFKEKVLDSSIPVLVDFSAVWCPPCRMMEPILEDFSNKYSSKIKVYKVDVDEAREVAAEYGIQAVPTFILFNSGQMVDQRTGGMPADDLENWVKQKVGL